MDHQSLENWESIYLQYRGALFAIAISVVGCDQLAEDAIHEAFVRIYRASKVPDDRVAYVFAAVRNSAIDLSRRAQRSRELHETIFNGQVPALEKTGPGETSRLLDRERDQILRKAIDGLAAEQREVVILKTFAGLTFTQIASITSAPAKTAETRYRRALDKLKQHLKGRL